MEFNRLDRFINYFSPSWANARMKARLQQETARRGYDAAKKGRRRAGRIAQGTSAANEVDRALVELRNSARELVRNNPYAKNAVRKIANNVIGTGIVPTPRIASRPQEKKLKQLWKDWAETTACDYDGHHNFYGIQTLVMRTVAESGECLVRKRIVNDPSLVLPLQLQVLEGDFIDTTKHGPVEGGGYIHYGVEFSAEGKVIAYHLYDSHPGDAWRFNLNSTRYPASDIIHIFYKERPGQYRGVPMLHASQLRIEDLDDYEDAELVRQKIAACFTLFVHDPANGGGGGPLTGDDDDIMERVEPGIIEHLPPGKQISAFTPPVTQGYGEYTKSVLRGVAAGVGMDYVTLTGDLTAVNFSSGRMGWLEFNRNITEWQWNMIVPMHCDKAWGWFVQMAQIFGYLRAGVKANASWSTPRREMINPEAETKAIIDQVQNKLLPWSEAIREMGYNPEEVLEQIKKDREDFKKAGLPDPSEKPATGTGTAPKKDAKPDPDQQDS